MIDFQLLLGIIGVYSLVGFLVATIGVLMAKQYMDRGDFIFLWCTWPFFIVYIVCVSSIEWYVDKLDGLKKKYRKDYDV